MTLRRISITPIFLNSLDKVLSIRRSSYLYITCHRHWCRDSFETRLALQDHYNENCIFVFDEYNKYNNSAYEVYSGQSIYIRKSEKHAWANNPYLYQTNIINKKMNDEKSQTFESIQLTQKFKQGLNTILTAEEEEEVMAIRRKQKVFNPTKTRVNYVGFNYNYIIAFVFVLLNIILILLKSITHLQYFCSLIYIFTFTF